MQTLLEGFVFLPVMHEQYIPGTMRQFNWHGWEGYYLLHLRQTRWPAWTS